MFTITRQKRPNLTFKYLPISNQNQTVNEVDYHKFLDELPLAVIVPGPFMWLFYVKVRETITSYLFFPSKKDLTVTKNSNTQTYVR